MTTQIELDHSGAEIRMPRRGGRIIHPEGARSNRTRIFFTIPALVLFTTVVIVPVFLNFFYAGTDWDGFAPSFRFVGLSNFVHAASDPQALQALRNTLIFTAVNAPIQIIVGLALALSLQGRGRIRSFLRVVIVMPIAISGVILGFIGDLIFEPQSGLLDGASHIPLFGWLAQNWLGEPSLAMSAVIAMNLWQWSGFTMLIFVAGLASLPSDLFEAAKIDGAGAWQRFRYVTWPMLAPAVTINVVLTVIGGMKVFDIIYVLTRGGPGNSTESIVQLVTQNGSLGEFGYSASISLALTLITLAISLLLLGALRRREVSA